LFHSQCSSPPVVEWDKTTVAGGPCGFDAGERINRRKHHALLDSVRRAFLLEPDPASVQDRNRGGPLLRASGALHRFIARLFASRSCTKSPIKLAS
jgi:hypothetical protein